MHTPDIARLIVDTSSSPVSLETRVVSLVDENPIAVLVCLPGSLAGPFFLVSVGLTPEMGLSSAETPARSRSCRRLPGASPASTPRSSHPQNWPKVQILALIQPEERKMRKSSPPPNSKPRAAVNHLGL